MIFIAQHEIKDCEVIVRQDTVRREGWGGLLLESQKRRQKLIRDGWCKYPSLQSVKATKLIPSFHLQLLSQRIYHYSALLSGSEIDAQLLGDRDGLWEQPRVNLRHLFSVTFLFPRGHGRVAKPTNITAVEI